MQEMGMLEFENARNVIPKYYRRFGRAVAIQCATAFAGAIAFTYALHRQEQSLFPDIGIVLAVLFFGSAFLLPILDLRWLYRLSTTAQWSKIEADLLSAEKKVNFWHIRAAWRQMRKDISAVFRSPDVVVFVGTVKIYIGWRLWVILLEHVGFVCPIFVLIGFDYFHVGRLKWEGDVVFSLILLVAYMIALPACYVYALTRFSRKSAVGRRMSKLWDSGAIEK